MLIATHLQRLCLLMVFGLASLAVYSDNHADNDKVMALRNNGDHLYQQGRYEDAIDRWQEALTTLPQKIKTPTATDIALRIELHRRLASALQVLGFTERAEKSLRRALELIQQHEATPMLAAQSSRLLGQLGNLALSDDRLQAAGRYIGESVEQARALQDPATLARALNNLGNALKLTGEDDKALAAYTEGLQWSQSSDEPALTRSLQLNLVRLHIKLNQTRLDRDNFDNHWWPAYDLFDQVATDQLISQAMAAPTTVSKANDYIALALLGQKLRQYPGLIAVKTKDNRDSPVVFSENIPAALRGNTGNKSGYRGYEVVDYIPMHSITAQMEQNNDSTVVELPKVEQIFLDRLSELSEALLMHAWIIARQFDDAHSQAYAHGYLAQQDEADGNYQQAIEQTQRALSFAEQAQDPANLYLWQWQLGRLYRKQGQNAAAIDAYRQAVATLTPIRNALMNNPHSSTDIFRERIQPVYFGLADLLLAQASQLSPHQASKQKTSNQQAEDDKLQREVIQQVESAHQTELILLQEARDTIETLKTAELQDFFQDECTVALQDKQTPLDTIDLHSAIIYPIILPQRLALLISIRGKLRQVTVPLVATQLEQTAHRFRRNLQFRHSDAYLTDAQQLYTWLVRPLEHFLKESEINTLVFVPDSILRTIPLATLHDGQQFLIERYAVAITPSLSLTDPRPFWRDDKATNADAAVLIAGLSESVQGFSALPSVPRELRSVQSLMGGEVLQDRQYLSRHINTALQTKEYSVLHMATHGVFGGSEEHSFLLTHDDRLNMSEISKLLRVGIFREQPLELLTLSACQTAVGNERAAFGLAGVAVQSGARSATASLWFVDDAATATLMSEFYRELTKNKLTKARALQNAQRSLLKQERYRHPIYWGPFLMIGNWL